MVVISEQTLSPHTDKIEFKYDSFTDALKFEIDDISVPRCPEVRFQTDQKVIMNPEMEFFDEEDTRIRWYSNEDLNSFRRNAKVAAAALRKESSQGCNVTLAHWKTALIVAAEFQTLVKLSKTSPDEDLFDWCFHNDGRRGLERLACKDYAVRRRLDMRFLLSSVMEEQHKQRAQNIRDPAAIALVSRFLSRRSRCFAAFMGGADAACVRQRCSSPGQ